MTKSRVVHPVRFYHSTQLNEHLWTQVLKHLNVHIYLVTIAYRYYNQLISRTDLSPIPVKLHTNAGITRRYCKVS